MNKTVNINLGGMFFHIDEDAYQKLNRYFDAIKRSISNTNGRDEIMKDIEMRIAELLIERNVGEKQVVSIRDVEAVITVMGQPEDYRIEDDEPAAANTTENWSRGRRKLYRDTEKGMIGGVATGLAHYTGIDAVWIKILLILITIISFGTGIVIYLIMWIVTPAAVTTSEKLEMTGEPVNISNIEKKVREEFDNISEKFKSADYDKMGRQVQTGAERFAGGFLTVLGKIVKVIAKIFGAFIAIFAGCALMGLIVTLFTFGSATVFGTPLENYAEAFNYAEMPLTFLAVLIFLSIGIPLFFLTILGLKLLVENLRSIGNFAKYSLLALWLVTIGILIAFGIKQASAVAMDGKSVTKEVLNLRSGDTLKVKFVYNDYYAKDLYSHNEMRLQQNEKGETVIYSDDVHLEVLPTDQPQPYVQIEREARGNSLNDARIRAEKIKYGFKIDGNTLILDNYLLSPTEAKYRKQKVYVYLFVPKGLLLKPDSSLQDRDWSDDNFFNLHFSGDYLYRVDKDKVYCEDCPPEENDFNDAELNVEDEIREAEEAAEQTRLEAEQFAREEAERVRMEAEELARNQAEKSARIKSEIKNQSERAKKLKPLIINENGVIEKTK